MKYDGHLLVWCSSKSGDWNPFKRVEVRFVSQLASEKI